MQIGGLHAPVAGHGNGLPLLGTDEPQENMTRGIGAHVWYHKSKVVRLPVWQLDRHLGGTQCRRVEVTQLDEHRTVDDRIQRT